jgi:hypothetical protein
VRVEKLALSNSVTLAALVELLDERGIVKRADVIERVSIRDRKKCLLSLERHHKVFTGTPFDFGCGIAGLSSGIGEAVKCRCCPSFSSYLKIRPSQPLTLDET